jgi:uncharacterized membrane protein AbrB (regulator of aidB expression)
MSQDPEHPRPSRVRMGAVTFASLLGAALAEFLHLPAGALMGGMLVALLGSVIVSVRVPVPRAMQLAAPAVIDPQRGAGHGLPRGDDFRRLSVRR